MYQIIADITMRFRGLPWFREGKTITVSLVILGNYRVTVLSPGNYHKTGQIWVTGQQVIYSLDV